MSQASDRPLVPFLILCATILLAFASYEWARSPLTSFYGESFGISESFIGFIVAASTLTGVVLKFPAGVLSDVFGRRRTLFAGLCFFALTPLASLFVTNPWALLAMRFVHGGATAIFSPVAMAVVADLYSERRAQAVGWYQAFALTGRAAGPLIMGLVLAASHRNYGLTYLLSAPLGLAAMVVLLFLRLPGRPQAASEGPVRRRIRDGFREAAGEGRILFTGAMEAVVMIATGAIQAFLPIYAVKVCRFTEIEATWLYGGQIVTSFLARPLMGSFSDRVGRKPMIVGGMVLAALSFAALPQTRVFPVLLSLAALFGLAEAVIHTSTAAFVADVCRRRSLGSAMGMFGAVMDAGHAAGPIVTGVLLTLTARNYGATFLAIAAAILAATILFAGFVRAEAPGEFADAALKRPESV